MVLESGSGGMAVDHLNISSIPARKKIMQVIFGV